MIDVEYKITFFSNWHCGSGLAAGADIDELVIKDKDKLPYVPGAPLKGCFERLQPCYSSSLMYKIQPLNGSLGRAATTTTLVAEAKLRLQTQPSAKKSGQLLSTINSKPIFTHQ